MRINSPYRVPEGQELVLLTADVNVTRQPIRKPAREKRLVPDPEKIVWGDRRQVPRKE